MKSVKFYLFGFFSCFIVIFLIGVILSFVYSKKQIYIKTIDDYDNKINNLEVSLGSVENTTCKESLTKLLDRSKNTYYINNVTINEYVKNYYEGNIDFYQIYMETLELCDNKTDDVKDITKLVIASKSFPETLKAKKNSLYEIRFMDFLNYKSVNELSDNIGSYSSKELELMALEKLIVKNSKPAKTYK